MLLLENQEKINWQEQQKKRILKIAYSEIDEALDNLLGPFGLIYENSCFNKDFVHNDSCDIEKFYQDHEFRFKRLTGKSFINYLDSVDLKSSPKYPDVYPKATWSELFFEASKRNQ